ncbi:MAG: ATP-binding protein, partial [Armatimonadota bacterium]
AASPEAMAVVGGHLTTVVALAFLSYAVCQILERERRSSEVMMRELSEGVVLLDSTGRIVAANRQIERLTGVGLNCMIGEQAADLAADDRYDILAKILTDARDDPRGQEFSAREISLDGPDMLDLLCTTARLPGPVGERIGYVVVCEDVTAIKSALRARTGGPAGLDEGVRSPTAVLKVASSMLGLLADRMHKEDHQRVLEVLHLDARGLVSNIATLMNMSSLEDPGLIANVSDTEVDELVRRIRRRLSVRAVRRNVTVAEELPERIPTAHIDGPRVEDALYRLCDNALRYSPEGGRISIAVETEGEMLHVSVTDEGPGVQMRHREDIFEKFVQIDPAGTDTEGPGLGLGLSIVRRVAELHNGEATVRNHADGGATFTLSLPMEPLADTQRVSRRTPASTGLSAAAVS